MNDEPTNPYGLSTRAAALISGDDHRCTATNRQGARCRRSRLIGQTVCDMHGGAAPGALAAARERTATFLFPTIRDAVQALGDALKPSAPRCDHCGQSSDDRDPVRLRTAMFLADLMPTEARALMTPTQAESGWAEHPTTAELDTIATIMAAAKARAAGARLALPAPDEDDVITIDAEDEDDE
jgi:hypothetical protein